MNVIFRLNFNQIALKIIELQPNISEICALF